MTDLYDEFELIKLRSENDRLNAFRDKMNALWNEYNFDPSKLVSALYEEFGNQVRKDATP